MANDEKTVLSFAAPEYLVNSGIIPVSSTDAYIASIFRRGSSLIENNLQQQKHLSIFEIIRTPEDELRPIWKMMGTLIFFEKEKLGVIEISRRSNKQEDAGEDFMESDLMFLENTMKKLAPYLKRAMPPNFRGKIT